MLSRNVLLISKSFKCHFRQMASTLVHPSNYQVQHDKVNKLFFIHLDEGNKALLRYELIDAGVLDLTHTEVPPQYQGRGIAKILAKAALDYVVKNDFQMKLTCWYLQDYVTKAPLPEYTKRIVDK